MARTQKRIWLEQENPRVGDYVTFGTNPRGANAIRLVIDERAAYYPPVDPDYDETKRLTDSFELILPGTAVAWLMKDEVAVAGTLFVIDQE